MSIATIPTSSSLSFSNIDVPSNVLNAPPSTTTTISPKDMPYRNTFDVTPAPTMSTGLQPYDLASNPRLTPLPPAEITLLQAPVGAFQPSNQDNINYSHLTGYSYATSVFESNDKFGGFCQYHQQNPAEIESICNGLDKNVCSSTQCCVLIGGEKCVAGNERGPTNYSNYNDPMILHRDLYYYQGKCFGNCPTTLNTNLVPAASAAVLSSTVNSAPISSSISSVSSYSQGQVQIPGQIQIMGQVPSVAQVPRLAQTLASQDQEQAAQPPVQAAQPVQTIQNITKPVRPAARFTGKVTTRKPKSQS